MRYIGCPAIQMIKFFACGKYLPAKIAYTYLNNRLLHELRHQCNTKIVLDAMAYTVVANGKQKQSNSTLGSDITVKIKTSNNSRDRK